MRPGTWASRLTVGSVLETGLLFVLGFPIHDRLRAEFRAEAFNVLNNVIYGYQTVICPTRPTLVP
jgi:hypothetical protein